MREILIIGASSAVAQEVGRIHAGKGDSLLLVGRNEPVLNDIAADLRIRGAANVKMEVSNLVKFSAHSELIKRIFHKMPSPWGIYIAHGTLPDQRQCEQDFRACLSAIESNALSQISMLMLIANKLAKIGSGRIAVISSVAGDRGRQGNYIYGAAKGMLSIYLQGLRNRLQHSGVHVLTAKPGFIDTPMTAAIEKKGLLWATPQKVASDIVRGVEKGKDIIYTPAFWYLIIGIIKLIPEAIFKRMRL